MDPVSKMDLNDSDESDSLKSCGLDDIENWIAMLNEDDAEPFMSDLKKFFADDLADNELEINFNKPVDNMQQTDNYQPLEMDFHQNPGAMAQFSQYPYAYGALGTYSLTQQPPGSPQSASAYGPLSLSSQPPSQRLSSNQMQQTDNYQPLEMDFHQNPGAMAQFSQYPYAYGALGTYSLTQQPPGSPQSASAYGPLSLSSQPPSQRLSSNQMQQTDNYQPLEMDFHQNTGAMAQFSQYPYAYGALGTYSLTQQPPGSPQSASAYGPLSLSSQPPSQRLSSNQLKELTEAIELCKRENMQDKECDDEVPSPKSHAVLLSYAVSFQLRRIINILKGMSNHELYSVLQSLKFEHVLDLFDCISHLYKKDLEIELCQTCAKILTNFNLERLLSSKQHHQILIDLKDLLFGSKAPLVSLQQDYIDKSSSESSLLKGGTIRYKGWTWVSNKTETPRNESIKEISNTDRDTPIESYFPEISSSSSSSGPPTSVPQAIEEGIAPVNPSPSYDLQGQLIICARCGYLKTTSDRINFVRAECEHVYCRTCANFVFSRRNKTKPHRCFNCNSIIHAAFNRHVKT